MTESSSTTYHTCPVVGCVQRVPFHMLMCWSHWQMVPRRLQGTVYREYRRGPQSDPHLRACDAAISAVNAVLTPLTGNSETPAGNKERPQ